uniref:Uncharacterized protein n=1 Tax=Acrobeloides nanus TaxID=290746 RepID=A0A914DTI9_9BILA
MDQLVDKGLIEANTRNIVKKYLHKPTKKLLA